MKEFECLKSESWVFLFSADLIDGVQLGRTVARLEKELVASGQAEKALTAELDKLASFQTLPDQVENLTKQVGATKVLCRCYQEELTISNGIKML